MLQHDWYDGVGEDACLVKDGVSKVLQTQLLPHQVEVDVAAVDHTGQPVEELGELVSDEVGHIHGVDVDWEDAEVMVSSKRVDL